MDKYVWHSTKDCMPPSYASKLILAVSNICPRKNEYGRYMIFGYYTPAYGINTWADEWHDKLDPNNYIVTHWMFAPDMPEEQI